MRHLLAWLADAALGPRCPLHHAGCNHRARGWRTLADHIATAHPGSEPTP